MTDQQSDRIAVEFFLADMIGRLNHIQSLCFAINLSTRYSRVSGHVNLQVMDSIERITEIIDDKIVEFNDVLNELHSKEENMRRGAR